MHCLFPFETKVGHVVIDITQLLRSKDLSISFSMPCLNTILLFFTGSLPFQLWPFPSFHLTMKRTQTTRRWSANIPEYAPACLTGENKTETEVWEKALQAKQSFTEAVIPPLYVTASIQSLRPVSIGTKPPICSHGKPMITPNKLQETGNCFCQSCCLPAQFQTATKSHKFCLKVP